MSNTRHAGIAKGDATHQAHGIDNLAPEAHMSSDIVNLGLHQFRRGIARYPEAQQHILEWLWGYTFDVLGNSKIELMRAVGYDYRFIYQVFTGVIDDINGFCEAVTKLKERSFEATPLVETVVTKKIVEALDYARDHSAMVTITGPTGRGKTYTSQLWARNNNHGRTRYIRVPSGCTRRMIATMIAAQAGIGSNGVKTAALEQRLFKAFSPRNVIIADEAGHLVPRSGSAGPIELLRDLHDICGCGIVMILTDVYLKDIKSGPSVNYFEQFIGRIEYSIEIPNDVFRSEVEAVVRHFNSQPTIKLIEYAVDIARKREGKLRMLFKDLARAKLWADRDNRPLSYEDLRLAVDWRRSGGLWPDN